MRGDKRGGEPARIKVTRRMVGKDPNEIQMRMRCSRRIKLKEIDDFIKSPEEEQ